jgi:hypothetical protein
MKIKKDSIMITVICMVIYRLSLDYANLKLFDSMYTQEADIFLSYETNKYLLSFAFFLFLAVNVAYVIKRITVSSIVIFVLFLLSYIPGTSLHGLGALPNHYFLYFNVYWFVIVFASRIIPRIKLPQLNIVGKSHLPFYIVVICASIYVVWISYHFTGFRISLSLSGSNINSLRYESYEFLTGIYAYISFWIGNIIIPLAIVHFFIKKKWILLVFVIFIQIILFSVSGTKTWLFLIPVCILGVMFYKATRIKYISAAFALINLIGVWAYYTLGNDFLTNMITRRMFVSQALNNYFFYDYFMDNNKDMLASSILRWFGAESIYTTPIPLIIADTYYHVESYASSGLFADAYSNFGVVGVFLYPIFLVIFFRIYEALAKGIDIKEIISILIASSVYLLNGSFFTVFLTFGLFAGMVVMLIYPRNNNSERSYT